MHPAFRETEKRLNDEAIERLVQSRIECLLDRSYAIGEIAGAEWARNKAHFWELATVIRNQGDPAWEFNEGPDSELFPGESDVDYDFILRGFFDGAISVWADVGERVLKQSSEVIENPHHPRRSESDALFACHPSSRRSGGKAIGPIGVAKH